MVQSQMSHQLGAAWDQFKIAFILQSRVYSSKNIKTWSPINLREFVFIVLTAVTHSPLICRTPGGLKCHSVAAKVSPPATHLGSGEEPSKSTWLLAPMNVVPWSLNKWAQWPLRAKAVKGPCKSSASVEKQMKIAMCPVRVRLPRDFQSCMCSGPA